MHSQVGIKEPKSDYKIVSSFKNKRQTKILVEGIYEEEDIYPFGG